MALRTRGMYFMYLGHTKLLVKICKHICAFEEGNLIRLKSLKSQRIMKHQLDLLPRFLKMPSAFWRILEHWWIDISLNVWLKKEQLQYRIKTGNMLRIRYHVKEEVNRGTCSNATIDTSYIRKRLRRKKLAKDRLFQEKVLNHLKHCVRVRQT